ncbi:MAG TPA: hypothetical protein VFC56_06445, partial [Stellaceae bacterium]|nr:hypothetical protein [Stellaceae bacterium]
AQLLAPILRPGDFSPHVVAPCLSDNNKESQLTEITQFISSQALRMRNDSTGLQTSDGIKVRNGIKKNASS